MSTDQSHNDFKRASHASTPASFPVDQIRQGAVEIVHILRNAGFQALWAGGCVRDEVMGRIPKDYDIASDAQPEQIESLFSHTHALGRAFGIVQVMHRGHGYEVARFRRDIGISDGRHPAIVEPSSPPEDACRRDFTINGLFKDPLTDEIFDYVGGLHDIQAGVIRAIGAPSLRFREDYLRMLRAVRFASTLDFTIAQDTFHALRLHAEGISRISMERVEQEITRTLIEAVHPGAALQLLHDTGLLARVLPEMIPLIGQEQPPQFHPEGDVWTHVKIMLDMLEGRNRIRVWSVLMHDIAKPPTAEWATGNDGVYRIRFNGHDALGAKMADDILRRFKFSNHDREAVVTCVAGHMRIGQAPKMRPATVRRLVSAETFDDELELHRVDCLSSHRMLESYDLLSRVRAQVASAPRLPEPLVGGRELIDAGLQPGSELGVWKKRIFDQQLEHPEWSRDDLMRWFEQSRYE